VQVLLKKSFSKIRGDLEKGSSFNINQGTRGSLVRWGMDPGLSIKQEVCFLKNAFLNESNLFPIRLFGNMVIQ
jgi:hypothetical protein